MPGKLCTRRRDPSGRNSTKGPGKRWRPKPAKVLANRKGSLAFDAKNLKLALWLRASARLNTYMVQERIARLCIHPTLGRIKLNIPAPTHVRGLYREKLESRPAPRIMVKPVHTTTLHTTLKQSMVGGLVLWDVAAGPPLLEAALGDGLEALYALSLTKGVKQGKFLGLKWEDVNLEDGETFQVQRMLSTATVDRFSFNAPKMVKSRRGQTTGVGLVVSMLEARMDSARSSFFSAPLF